MIRMIIFPLSIPGKIVLIIIAAIIGLIWSMLMWPEWWKAKLRKGGHSQYLKNVERIEAKVKAKAEAAKRKKAKKKK